VKRTVLLAAVALLLGQQAFAGPWIKSLATAQKQAKDNQRLIFVDLYADWCGWCKRMEQEVFPSQAFQNATDNMVLLRLNTEDAGEGTKLSRELGVNTLPTFLILAPDGILAGVIHGYAPSDEFVRALKEQQTQYVAFAKKLSSEKSLGKNYQQRLDLARELRTRYALTQSETRLKKILAESPPVDVRDNAYYELSTTQAMQQHFDDAIATLRKFATVENKGEAYERSRLLLGQVYMSQGKFDSAVAELRNFKRNFPSSPLVKNVDLVLPQIEQQAKKK
jgi:thioredoxin-related protein